MKFYEEKTLKECSQCNHPNFSSMQFYHDPVTTYKARLRPNFHLKLIDRLLSKGINKFNNPDA
jgi:hypothetical protein